MIYTFRVIALETKWKARKKTYRLWQKGCPRHIKRRGKETCGDNGRIGGESFLGSGQATNPLGWETSGANAKRAFKRMTGDQDKTLEQNI